MLVRHLSPSLISPVLSLRNSASCCCPHYLRTNWIHPMALNASGTQSTCPLYPANSRNYLLAPPRLHLYLIRRLLYLHFYPLLPLHSLLPRLRPLRPHLILYDPQLMKQEG